LLGRPNKMVVFSHFVMRTVELSHFLQNRADLLGRPNKLVVFSHFVMRTVKLSHFLQNTTDLLGWPNKLTIFFQFSLSFLFEVKSRFYKGGNFVRPA